MSRTGIIVGRFQVPYLHAGHLHLIATALRESDKVVIFIGCERVGIHNEDKNPYGYDKRYNMIHKIFPQAFIKPIYDRETNQEWSERLDEVSLGENNPTLYHSRDSFKEQYTGSLPLREVEEIPGLSGTKLRESLK